MLSPLAIPLAWLITTIMYYCNCVWQTRLQNKMHETLKMLNKLESEVKE